jgi:hypothetical protein
MWFASFAGTVAIGALVILALWMAFWGVAGAVLSSQRGGRGLYGLFWGAFFGPIGLMIVWMLTRSVRSSPPHDERGDEPPWST